MKERDPGRHVLIRRCLLAAAIGLLLWWLAGVCRQCQIAGHLEQIGGITGMNWFGYVIGYQACERSSHRIPHRPRDVDLIGLSELTQLRLVWLDGTDISDETLERIRGLRKVEQLVLNGTRITDAGLEHLQGWSKLKSLSLAGTRLSGLGLRFLSHLRRLQSLDLRETPLCDEALPIVFHRARLEDLDLSGSAVSDAGFLKLAACSTFREIQEYPYRISLCATTMSDKAVPILVQFRGVRYLDLRDTRITDAGLLHLAELASLRALDVSQTNISHAAIERFRELRPDVTVNHVRQRLPTGKHQGDRLNSGAVRSFERKTL